MGTIPVSVLVLVAVAAGAEGPRGPIRPFESSVVATPQGHIDEIVFAKWKEAGVTPPFLCSDEVFIRRAYLDVIGTLPNTEEVRRFLRDSTLSKRRALIDRLMQRDEFVDYWAMKWCDLLRVKAEFPINLWPNAAQAYSRWVRTCVQRNMPYDRFARELLTTSGSNFRSPQVNFYRAMQNREPAGIAQTVALTFLGERADRWPKERLDGMAAFFLQLRYKATSEWKEEIVYFDPGKARVATSARTQPTARFPDGTEVFLPPGRDPRQVFADWLVRPENTAFSRAIVNRIWFWLLGRGIIHEPDDIRPDNPPSHPELLNFLEKELVSSHYDLQHVFRLILTSRTYQLSSLPRSKLPPAEDTFARYPVRRLEAEVLIDALDRVTGTTESYTSAIPEPFTFMPENQRSIALPDGSITSPFLEMFGRPPRDTGRELERNNRLTAEQEVSLLNSTHIRRKIEQGLVTWSAANAQPIEQIDQLYLAILSRHPTDEEVRIVDAYSRAGSERGKTVLVDLGWALINSEEFLYRH